MSNVKVFTVRRTFSNGIFSVRVSDHSSIIAFKTKNAARGFVAMEKSMWARPQQALCIDEVHLDKLLRRCSLNSLQLTLYDDKGNFEVVDRKNDLDDVQFHLENVLKYYGDA